MRSHSWIFEVSGVIHFTMFLRVLCVRVGLLCLCVFWRARSLRALGFRARVNWVMFCSGGGARFTFLFRCCYCFAFVLALLRGFRIVSFFV